MRTMLSEATKFGIGYGTHRKFQMRYLSNEQRGHRSFYFYTVTNEEKRSCGNLPCLFTRIARGSWETVQVTEPEVWDPGGRPHSGMVRTGEE